MEKSEWRILVTGGSGFIGTNLMDLLRERHPNLVNYDQAAPMLPDQTPFWRKGDIMDADATAAFFREYQPTHVVHLAARCDCDEKTTVEEGYRANTTGTENVLKAIRAAGTVDRLVVTSTQFVFNKEAQLPAGDEDYAPRTVYGHSKIITERLTRELAAETCWTLIRPTNVWGPWHIRHTRQFFRILKLGLYFHPGRQTVMRSYAYVGNVVDQIARILEADRSAVDRRTLYVGDPPLNLLDWVDGFSRELTGKRARVVPIKALKAVALAGDGISRVTGKDFFLTSSRLRSMTLDYLTPMDKTYAVIGPCRYDMREGIRRTAEWLRQYEKSGWKVEGDRPMGA